MKRLLTIAALLCLSAGVTSAQQINPGTQIRWPACTAGQSYIPYSNNCASSSGGVTSFNARNGAVTLQPADLTGAIGTQNQSVVCFVGPASGSGTTGCRQLTPADIAPAFSATFGCTQCGTYESGYAGISAASGTIGYASPTVPASASVSDGTNTTTLSTPFTSWTLSHAYTVNTTFTLTAVGNGQTVTQTQGIVFLPRTFGGVGTAGATGATASGTNAVLAGATGTLASAGLANQPGYGPYVPSGQKIYVLMTGGSHTFTSGGFAFPMNTPVAVSFVNQNGATVALYLYESTNVLSGTFSLVVAS